MPPELDAQIEAAARSAHTTYSGWLAAAARNEFLVQAGLDAVAEFEQAHGSFSAAEVAEAETWANDVTTRSPRSGQAQRRTA